MTFERTFKGTTYRLSVMQLQRAVGYKLADTIYHSPSAAAKAVTGNDVNGWWFWRIDERRPSPGHTRGRRPRSLPSPGTIYVKRYKGRRYVMRVLPHNDGVAFEVLGRIHSSPTAAARAVTGTSVNGWVFWGIA
jgi:hypothetical protein